MNDIPQPYGEVVANWYEQSDPAMITILETLARALAGEITLDDLKGLKNG